MKIYKCDQYINTKCEICLYSYNVELEINYICANVEVCMYVVVVVDPFRQLSIARHCGHCPVRCFCSVPEAKSALLSLI